jgi:hypothetical protein
MNGSVGYKELFWRVSIHTTGPVTGRQDHKEEGASDEKAQDATDCP